MKPSYDNADKHRADVEQPSKVALSGTSEYSPILVNRSSVNASNSSERTYFVKAAETDGCDWPPFFANIHFHPHRTVMSITVNQGV